LKFKRFGGHKFHSILRVMSHCNSTCEHVSKQATAYHSIKEKHQIRKLKLTQIILKRTWFIPLNYWTFI